MALGYCPTHPSVGSWAGVTMLRQRILKILLTPGVERGGARSRGGGCLNGAVTSGDVKTGGR